MQLSLLPDSVVLQGLTNPSPASTNWSLLKPTRPCCPDSIEEAKLPVSPAGSRSAVLKALTPGALQPGDRMQASTLRFGLLAAVLKAAAYC